MAIRMLPKLEPNALSARRRVFQPRLSTVSLVDFSILTRARMLLLSRKVEETMKTPVKSLHLKTTPSLAYLAL